MSFTVSNTVSKEYPCHWTEKDLRAFLKCHDSTYCTNQFRSLSPELKSKDFKLQEKRERKISKTVGGKKERKKERTDNKNPKQTAGYRSTSIK